MAAVEASTDDGSLAPAATQVWWRRLHWRWPLVGLAVLAFLIRLIPVLIGGGLSFYGRYDDGVYYAGADALSFGRLPYKSFTLLHPPLLLLVLSPFALLGRLTTDATGMAVARLAFMAIGALNTVLVALIARRWGTKAAVIGGLMYASWLPAVYGEQSTMLEPLGSTALCVALLLLLRHDQPSHWPAWFAGLALGLAATDKIWYVAPLAAVVVWQLAARRFRTALWISTAAAVAIAVVITPFAALTGSRMWDMVIRDQVLRPQVATSRFSRLTSILGLKAFATGQPSYLDVLTVVGVVVLVMVAVACWRQPRGRVLVWIFAVNLTVLMMAPPFYQHYAAFTAVPAALMVAIAISRLERLPRPRMRLGLVTAGVLIAVSAAAVVSAPRGDRFPAAFGRLAPRGCTTADDPQVLIDMNRLSSDLRSGCPLPVDVTGITYDRLDSTPHRRDNLPWQHYLVGYLFSGTSFVLIRARYDELDRYSKDLVSQHPIIADDDHLRLHRGAAEAQPQQPPPQQPPPAGAAGAALFAPPVTATADQIRATSSWPAGQRTSVATSPIGRCSSKR